jgi:hypothetical protein
MSIEKIKNLLMDEKGYYNYDHAISAECIKDIIWAYKKVEKIKAKKLEKKLKEINSQRTRKVLVEKK